MKCQWHRTAGPKQQTIGLSRKMVVSILLFSLITAVEPVLSLQLVKVYPSV